jgi:hypothetical protein
MVRTNCLRLETGLLLNEGLWAAMMQPALGSKASTPKGSGTIISGILESSARERGSQVGLRMGYSIDEVNVDTRRALMNGRDVIWIVAYIGRIDV